MGYPLYTVCHNQLRFESLFSKEVIADLRGGQITSDAGVLLLGELDQRYRIAEKAAAYLHDPRDAGKIKHDLLTLVRQRLFAIAIAYKDNNDAPWPAKVEYHHLGANQRFVVTNLVRNPQFVYEDIYVLRGGVENRIEEFKLELKAHRLSCHRFLANQFRLLLHTAAYCLFWLRRHHLQDTEMAMPQVNTLRLKLLKIGARTGCTWPQDILTTTCWPWCCKTFGPAPVNLASSRSP